MSLPEEEQTYDTLNDPLARIEASLDGELPADQADAPSRQAILQQRALRAAYFSSLAPSAAEAQALSDRLMAAVHAAESSPASEESEDQFQQERRLLLPSAVSAGNPRRLRIALRWAVAACVACFLAGWLGHSAVSSQVAMHQPNSTTPHAVKVASNTHASDEESAPVIETGSGTQAKVATLYQVALTDSNGKVTAVQTFKTMNEARQFAQDVNRWHQHEHDVRGSQPIVVASEF